MKWTRFASLIVLTLTLSAGTAFAGGDEVYRNQSDFNKMLHKLGRGVTNVVTCWVEVPRNIAIQWECTDPVTGFILGTVKGTGWGVARLATGVFDAVTFPFPVPPGYAPLIEPEFVVTDIWGDPIPELTELGANDPGYPTGSPVYPERFTF